MSLLHRTFSADGVSVSLDRAKRLPVARPSLNFQISPTPSSHNSTTLLQSSPSPSSTSSAMPNIDGSHPIMYHRQHANSLDLSALAQASREMGFHSAIASSSSSSSRHYHPIVSSHRPQHSPPSYSPPSTGGGMHRSPSSGSIGIGLSRYDHRSSPVDIPRPRVSIKRPSRSPDFPATPTIGSLNDPSIPHSQLIPMSSNVTTSSSGSSASPRPLPTSAPILPVVFPDEFEVLGPAGDSTCETYIVRSKITGATSVFKPAAGEAYREKGKPLPASVSGARVRLLPPNSDALSTSPPSANSDDALSPLHSPMGSPPVTIPNEASSLFVQEDTRTPLKHGVVYGDATVKEAAAFLLDHEHFAGVPPTTVATLLLKRSRSRQHLLTASDQENVNHRDRDETKTDDNKIDREIVVPVYGSLQQFAENEGSAEDMGTGMFSVDEVHKIGVLDIRLLNLDRHLANILVSRDSDNQYHLVPIDHGYILPSYRDLRDVRLEWQWWKQCSVPFSDKTQNYIARLNPLQDAITLRALGLREESIISMVFASILLKRAAAEGLTLDVIASMVQRKPSYRDDEDADRAETQGNDDDSSEPSCLENIITKVLSMVATQGLSRPALPEPEPHAFIAPHTDDDFPRITLMGSPSMRAISEPPSDPDLSPSPFSRRSSSSSSSNGAPHPSLDGARVLVANALSIPPKFDLDAPLDGHLEEFTERATPASSPSLHRQTSSVSTGSNPSLSRTSSSTEDHDDALIQVARAFLSGSPASGPVDIVRSMNGCTIEEHTGSPPSSSSHMPSASSSPTNDAVPAAGGTASEPNSVPFESTSHLDHHLNGEMPSFPARSSSEPASSSSTGDLLVHDRVRLERLLELTVNVMDEEIDKAKRIQAEESIARQEREARWGPPRKLSSNSSNQLVAVNSELAALSRVRSSPTSFARQLIMGIQHAISVDL